MLRKLGWLRINSPQKVIFDLAAAAASFPKWYALQKNTINSWQTTIWMVNNALICIHNTFPLIT